MPAGNPPDPPKRRSKAPWRRGFDAAERGVGGRVEPAVQRPEFAAGLGLVKRIDGKVRGIVGGATSRVLHALNIPTVGDVRRLHEHLNAMDAHLSEVVREQDRTARDARHPTRTSPPRGTEDANSDESAKGASNG